MPFRVPGPDLIDPDGVCYLLAEFARASLPEGAEMVRLIDPILTVRPPPNGIELPPLSEPETLEAPRSYVSTESPRSGRSRDVLATIRNGREDS